MTTINEDSASDLTSSWIPDSETQVHKPKDSPQNHQTVRGIKSRTKPKKITPLSSFETQTSSEPVTSSNVPSILTKTQSAKFHQRIENAYVALQRSEAAHCYYLKRSSLRACDQLKQSPNGTYFVRPAEETKRVSNIEYYLVFVYDKEVAQVPICCDLDRRTFWFRSGYGHGSEVQKFYAGIDIMIEHKRNNNFYELQYPFQISLYRPIDRDLEMFDPLPDEVRARGGPHTILHKLATQGAQKYFNELMRISKEDDHPLRWKCKFIVNKIHARNEQGQTPLILAIQSKQYEFAELLLDNKANINMTDSHGCSPLQHVCQQGNPQILKKLIDRGADPHYFNRRETTDGTHQSYLSAFHYLAMAKKASTGNIRQCAMYLIECGCAIMPLTKEGKSPFDIAQMYDNKTFECLKRFCEKHHFNNLPPIEVSSRDSAKTFLRDLACPSIIGKVRSLFNRYDNRDCLKNNGLFLLYRIPRSKNQPNEEVGLCVHHNGQIFLYPITKNYQSTITDSSDPLRKISYNCCLTTGTLKDEHSQVIVFRCCEELIYNYSKHRGILPVLLKDFVQKTADGTLITMDVSMLLLTNTEQTIVSNPEESDPEDEPIPADFNVTSIDSFDLSQISSLKLFEENHRRLIWTAKVRLNQGTSFPIIIKDYLPSKDTDAFKKYRFNEFNTHPRQRNHNSRDEFPYEFSSRTHLEYNHESEILLSHLKNHPLIVHTFLCDHHSKRGLRLFMEYLPHKSLHDYLGEIEPNSLVNAFHWIYQIAQVMAYLSNKKIVHRDLATRNILLKNEQHIKLSDFGLSRFEGEILEEKDFSISPRWTAPECFDRNQKVLSSADVWSFGVLIWEICSFGGTPYETDTIVNNDSQQLIRLLRRFLIEEGRRLSRPDFCSEGLYDLMCRCWNGNLDKRPRFVDIINDINGMSMIKDRVVSFTREERKIWEKAKKKYLIINPPATFNPEYVPVEDVETDDKDTIVTIKL